MSAQNEQLKAIGTRLSEERQKKSISLEEIAAKTYIPQRLLSAIEEANLDRLPEPVFIQGFIRRFADALGLDGIAMSKEFTVDPTPLPAPATTSLLSDTIAQPSKPPASLSKVSALQASAANSPNPSNLPISNATEPPAIRDPYPVQKSLEPAAVRDSIPEPYSGTNKLPARLPLIALVAAIGLGAIGVLASTLANRPAQRSTPTAATSPAAKSAQPPVAVQPPRSSAASLPTGSVTVKMNVTDESWVEVLVDGKSVYEGTLTKGTQKSWSGKQVVVNSGNAGGVSLSYNNGSAKAMGAAGQVQTATFPPTP